MNAQRGTVILTRYAGLTHRRLLLRLRRRLHRTASPAYAHCLLLVGQWVFEYGSTGYKVGILKGQLPEGSQLYEVELRNPEYLLNWQNPKPQRFGLLRIPFKNCATEVAKTIGVRARTPDQLDKLFRGKEEATLTPQRRRTA